MNFFCKMLLKFPHAPEYPQIHALISAGQVKVLEPELTTRWLGRAVANPAGLSWPEYVTPRAVKLFRACCPGKIFLLNQTNVHRGLTLVCTPPGKRWWGGDYADHDPSANILLPTTHTYQHPLAWETISTTASTIVLCVCSWCVYFLKCHSCSHQRNLKSQPTLGQSVAGWTMLQVPATSGSSGGRAFMRINEKKRSY